MTQNVFVFLQMEITDLLLKFRAGEPIASDMSEISERVAKKVVDLQVRFMALADKLLAFHAKNQHAAFCSTSLLERTVIVVT